jgi:DNA adenine methylase
MTQTVFEQAVFPYFQEQEEGHFNWANYQQDIFSERKPPKQLLKWIGNKQRFAAAIAKLFPDQYRTYLEPFVGSGAVLGAMAPKKGIAGDILKPLIEMWNLLKENPLQLVQ